MSLTIALIVILFSTLMAAFASIAVHRKVHLDVRRRHSEVGTAVFLQLGVIFAVLLAFVFSEVWSQYNAAASAVEFECGSLEDAATLMSAMPADQARPLLAAEAAYVAAVVKDEWPEMFASRTANNGADQKLTSLIQNVVRLRPTSPADLGTRQQLLVYLEQAHNQRTMRIFQLASGIPLFLWALLIGLGAILAAFVTMAGVESGRALASFSMTFAATVAAILVLIHLLDYPFEGALAMQPDHFVTTLQKITALEHSLQ
jgi:hypothetical protein